MTHEPECPWRFEDDCHVVAAGVTFCEVIRAAYRRGREDEKAVWMNPCWQCGMNADSAYICDGCLEENASAARWDGEQA